MQVIAISGQPGSGSTTTAKLLSKKMDLIFFSVGQLWKDIGKGVVEGQEYYPIFKKICEEKGIALPSMLEKNDSLAVEKIWQDLGKTEKFNSATDELQKRLAKEKSIVLEGKLSLRMIENANLKIWLKASLDSRASRMSFRDKMPFEEIKNKIEERQEVERECWKKIYGFDYWDQEKEADIVIDSSYLTTEEIIDKIVSKLNGKL